MALPIRSVGVKADLRSYEHPVLISGDAPWSGCSRWRPRCSRRCQGINRCIWNLGPGAPGSVTPLAATVTRERLDLLREADAS